MRVTIKVISLVEATARRAFMSRQLNDLPVEWQFVDASRSLPSTLSYAPQLALRHRGRPLLPSELGCFASHYRLWTALLDDTEFDTYCVLEDDLLIDPTFFRDLSIVGEVVKTFGYLRLYAKMPCGLRRLDYDLDGRYCVRFTGLTYGTQGYLITKPAAKKFIDSIAYVSRPIDDEMDRSWHNRVSNTAIFPFPIIEVKLGSSIGSDRRARIVSMSDYIRYKTHRFVEKARRFGYNQWLDLGYRVGASRLP